MRSVCAATAEIARGSRREHRQYSSALGGQNLGDSLLFNELKWRKKKLQPSKSAIHAWGLYALDPIEKEDFVCEYMGEYIRSTVAESREHFYRRYGYGDDYIFRVSADHLVDATRKGAVARFANHCCDPNCYTRIIRVQGQDRIVLYSKRQIEAGEEITYDYKFDLEEDRSLAIPCMCGAGSRCRKFLN